MVREETRDCVGTEQGSRALVEVGPGPRSEHRLVGGHPKADFLTQLIVGADPALRPSRLTRTAEAASVYARTSGGRP